MTDPIKRIQELQEYVERCKEAENEDSRHRKSFHAILCQLNALVEDLGKHHLIWKCRCCDED